MRASAGKISLCKLKTHAADFWSAIFYFEFFGGISRCPLEQGQFKLTLRQVTLDVLVRFALSFQKLNAGAEGLGESFGAGAGFPLWDKTMPDDISTYYSS